MRPSGRVIREDADTVREGSDQSMEGTDDHERVLFGVRAFREEALYLETSTSPRN